MNLPSAQLGSYKPLNWTSLLAYGALGFPLAFAALPLYVHVSNLYADSGLLSLASLGTILWLSRLADAVFDPLLGQLSDRMGKPLWLIGCAMPLLTGGLWCLLNPPNASSLTVLHLTTWLTLSLLLTYLGFSLVTINYHTWGASLGNYPTDRLRVTSTRELMSLAGVITAAVLPGLLTTSNLPAEKANALSNMAWLFIPVALLCTITTLRAAPRPMLVFPTQKSLSICQALRHVWQDKTYLHLLAVMLLSGLAAAIPATLVLFFIADVLQLSQWQGGFLAIYFLSAGASLPLWNLLAKRRDATTAWAAGMGLAILSFIWAFYLYSGAAIPFALICLLTGSAFGAELAIPPAILADHLARKKTQAIHTAGAGAYFGVWQFVNKLTLAMAAGIALPLVSYLGYKVGAGETATMATTLVTAALSTTSSQTTAARLTALATIYALLPAAIKSLALIWLWRHKNYFEGEKNEHH